MSESRAHNALCARLSSQFARIISLILNVDNLYLAETRLAGKDLVLIEILNLEW